MNDLNADRGGTSRTLCRLHSSKTLRGGVRTSQRTFLNAFRMISPRRDVARGELTSPPSEVGLLLTM